jgi:hypothetical protein
MNYTIIASIKFNRELPITAKTEEEAKLQTLSELMDYHNLNVKNIGIDDINIDIQEIIEE